jgi:lactate racemase
MDFLINVTLNARKQITGVFSGHPVRAFERGIEFCRKSTSDLTQEKFDVVVTSGGGAPLDRNFYQTVKGMVGALDVVKKGGTIFIASGCRDGLGSGDFKKLLKALRSPKQYLKMISKKDFFCLDQWQVEELAKAMKKAKIKLYTEGLSKKDTKIAGLCRIDDISKEVKNEIGKNIKLRVGVIPNGPYVLAKHSKEAS